MIVKRNTHVVKYELIDVQEPQLYREIFPYTTVPRVVFDNVIVPMNMPSDIFITDTTFRDGQQSRLPFTVDQIVKLYTLMHKLGGPNGIIRQSEFFLYSKKDRAAVEACLEKGYKYPEVTAWIRANKKDFELVKQMQLKETGILTSISDYHIFLKLRKTRKEAIKGYLEVVEAALENDITPRCHLEDITRADFYGCVLPFVQKLMDLASQAKKKIKIRACDTMGFGIPFVEAALPRSVPKMMHVLINEGGVPSEWLEWHGHNDFHKVHINSTTAWLYGCAGANGTLLGIGERTGNSPIEALIIEYIALTGKKNGIDTTVITEIGKYFEKELKHHIPTNYPFLGRDFNVTRAGIHADGMLKNEEIYNIFDTAKLLNRPIGVIVTDKSGTAGIAYWVNSYLKLSGKKAVDKSHPGIKKMYEWLVKQFEEGRVTGLSNEEMLEAARKFLPDVFKPIFVRLKERAIEMSEKILKDTAKQLVEIIDNEEAVNELLRMVRKEHPFIQRLYITDKEGIQITDNIVSDDILKFYGQGGRGVDKSMWMWVKSPVSKRRQTVSDFYKSNYTGMLCISIGTPIVKDKKVLGVLVADIKFEELMKYDEIEEGPIHANL